MFARAIARNARSYATQAAAVCHQLVAEPTLPNLKQVPPIQLHGLSGKYAGALFSAALGKSAATLKQVETDLQGVSSVIKAESSVQEFLSNPVLSSKDRAAGIESLLKKGSKGTPSEITKNLFEVLADNGRLYESEKVIADFFEILSAHRGEVKVVITSAVPLEKDIQKRLEDALKQSVKASEGKSVIFENKINESVLGGVVVDFGDKTIDLSVASKVNKLNAALQVGIPLIPSI
ncbi:F1 complex, OSCP/delta subunit of ATPase [Meredithblackwellia eburnea MCA 4105]